LAYTASPPLAFISGIPPFPRKLESGLFCQTGSKFTRGPGQSKNIIEVEVAACLRHGTISLIIILSFWNTAVSKKSDKLFHQL
jgi:hypothetical protein